MTASQERTQQSLPHPIQWIVYRQEVEKQTLRCWNNNLELEMLKTVELTLGFGRSPLQQCHTSSYSATLFAEENNRLLGCTITQNLKSGIQHQHPQEKGPAEDVLIVPAQEVWPVSRATDPVLHCSHPVHSVHWEIRVQTHHTLFKPPASGRLYRTLYNKITSQKNNVFLLL